ncbi:DUF7352 domain-containing protein [Albibacterium profundi]|uniref:DUF7352 domain-containing protein n=1 Tax=Albibacterium profundi TaxID=3134906 RepID=A0ABV5CHL0_9SPHI
MNTIYKYEIHIKETFTLSLPVGANILCFKSNRQTSKMYLYAKVDTEASNEQRSFALVGTGAPIDFNNGVYIGTVKVGFFVWHLFEILY